MHQNLEGSGAVRAACFAEATAGHFGHTLTRAMNHDMS
jgi:hypothetical protein